MVKTVVVIDDDFDDYTFLKDAIEEFDPSVKCVYYDDSVCAMDTLNAVDMYQPDYIFIDINMPKATGDECLRLLRKNKNFDTSIIVMFSTFMSTSFAEVLIQDGANYATKKPNSMNEYLTLLSEILN